MTEEKKKNIFSRAFNSVKTEFKNLDSMDKDLINLINTSIETNTEIEDVNQIIEIGTNNNINEENRIIDAFTNKLNDKFKTVIKENVQDEIFTNTNVISTLSILNSMVKFTNKKRFKSEILDNLSKYTENSSLIYDDLDSLATTHTSINLVKGEVCFLDNKIALWKEQKTKTKRVNYGGVGVSFKIAKGVYLRSGSINTQPVKESFLENIIQGELIITNKRIIIDSGNDIKIIKLNNILKVTPYTDSIAIHKGTNSPALLYTNMNHVVLAAFITRVIQEN